VNDTTLMRPRTRRPTFLGALGGEALKLRRQGWNWAMLGLAVLLFMVLSMALLQAGVMRANLERSPRGYVYTLFDIYLAIFDSGAGIFLLVVSARLVGMEYSGGTIRVLLGRGAGRLRLLLAKLGALLLLGLVLLAGYLVLAVGSVTLSVLAWEGSLAKLTALPAQVWADGRLLLLAALASIAIAVLIGATSAMLGRSLAFGLGAALAFFPADNLLVEICSLLAGLTRQRAFADLTAYLLGPNLNVLPHAMLAGRGAHAAFAVPAVPVTAAHAWLVVAGWAAAMLAAAITAAKVRDVLE
jgi:ABC-2 type transport system permease protein